MSKFLTLQYLLLFIIGILLFSCNNNQQYEGRIKSIETIIEEHPDSALIILDSVMLNCSLNEKNRNRLQLLRVQAKDKSYRDITSDTIIFDVREYFIEKRDHKRAALSSFYCGRVLQEQSKDKEALNEYIIAEEFSQKSNNNNLKALIYSSMGSVFLKQFILSEAKIYFLKAADYFHTAENSRNEIITYNNIGNVCLMNSENDSAFFYYQKGLALAESVKDSVQMSMLRMSIGITYRQQENYGKAIDNFALSAKVLPESSDKSKLLLNLSKTFYDVGEIDSAKYYIKKSLSLTKEDGDIFVKANIYKTLSKIEELTNNYQQSLIYHKKYTETLEKILDENNNKEILELKKKYQYEQFENENNKLKIKQQKIFLIFAIILLLIVLIAVYFYIKSVKNKKIALEKQNEILDAEKKIYQLIEMSKSFDNENNSFRDILLHHFDILRKAATLEKYVKGDSPQEQRLIKLFNEIVYGQTTLNWDQMYKTMNRIHNGLFERLHDKYPSLDEIEFRICSLTYANFTCAEIGIVIGLSANTVQMKRSIIRKKLGVESQGNIQSFLDQQLHI